ncbi:hypothetical protein R0137_01455 [Congregibacter brevis]|uniref:Uncharacterized protein n=1 Tax=Congregibacter brevis TaxID=3081201 RepID=A0ABZ0IGL1_9GAMM|nr:hypothetical protein R0137_01455 [Congregibacter sp. IMCC45268]
MLDLTVRAQADQRLAQVFAIRVAHGDEAMPANQDELFADYSVLVVTMTALRKHDWLDTGWG